MAILKIIDENETVAIEADGDVDFGQALGLCLDGIEALVGHAVKHADETEELNKFHDYLTYAFTSIIERNFNDEGVFGLTEAAVFKAQNEILEESMETGKPIDEVIERYNKSAEEYVNKIKEN